MKSGPKCVIDWKAIQSYYDAGHTVAECRIHFKRPNLNFHRGKKLGLFKGRRTWKIKRVRRKCSKKTRKILSKLLKARHRNGTAWTFAHNSHKESWPEKWFKRVIANEFTDKVYIAEYRFNRYSLDFAWAHKKKVIEVDGEQHYSDPGQVKSDKRKDECLKQAGWKVLRLPWRKMCKQPAPFIQVAKQFIDG